MHDSKPLGSHRSGPQCWPDSALTLAAVMAWILLSWFVDAGIVAQLVILGIGVAVVPSAVFVSGHLECWSHGDPLTFHASNGTIRRVSTR